MANTCANLLKLWPALRRFIDHPGVTPINNAANQARRSIVLKRKISVPTRSRRGDDRWSVDTGPDLAACIWLISTGVPKTLDLPKLTATD